MSPAILQELITFLIGVGGIFVFLVGMGKIKRYRNDAQRNTFMLARWGTTLKIVGILMAIGGLQALPRLIEAIKAP